MTTTTKAADDGLHPLVNRSHLARGAAIHDAATDRLRKAEDELKNAKHVHHGAKAAADRAIAGFGPDSALEADAKLQAAERALGVAEKVHASASAQHASAVKARDAAVADAHRPVYLEGARKRLAATEKAQRGLAMIEEAAGDYAEGNAMLDAAHSAGVPHILHPAKLGFGLRRGEGGRHLTTPAEERATWADAHLDVDRGTFHGAAVA